MKTIQLAYKLPDEDVDKLKGDRLNESHYDILIEDAVRVLKPDGSLLCQIIRGAVNDMASCQILSDKIKGLPDNRGTSTGKDLLTGQGSNRKRPVKSGENSNTTRVDKSAFRVLLETPIQTSKNRGSSTGNQTKNTKILQNGSVSKTTQQIDPETGKYLEVNSGIIGYFDRYPRFPYARETSFLIKYRAEWQLLQPFINKVNDIFKEYAGDRYAIQKEIAERCAKEWIIGDTAFSTITVNKSYRTACHKDAGDLAEGFGVMTYFQTGGLQGGYLVLPAYRVAIKLQHADVILFDVHEWHGNTEIKPLSADAKRITCVFYLRDYLLRCGDAKYEIQRAKKVRQLAKLYDDEEIQKAEQIKTEVFKKYGISYPYPKQKTLKKQAIRSAKK